MNNPWNIWVAGARPNTLPASVAPVIAGLAIAVRYGTQLRWGVLCLAFVVALALQIGVNYANDYSDGIRGTDAVRVGPTRLVASGAASARAVKWAAFACFGVAALAGLIVVAVTQHWWLVILGALAIVAAWFYTGGKRPYGYAALGEVMVFIFFGLMATVGTAYVVADVAPLAAWVTATGIGALACALLVANNLRDAEKDRRVGKHTLATKLGDRNTRVFFIGLLAVGLVSVLWLAALMTPWVLLAGLAFIPVLKPVRELWRGAQGVELIPMLRSTSLTELAMAVGLLLGVLVA